MKKLLAILSFSALIVICFGCGKEEKSTADLIKRKWTLLDKDSTNSNFIHFKTDPYSGSSNFSLCFDNNDTIYGEWELEKKNITLSFTPNNIDFPLDNFVFHSDERGNASIELYQDENKFATIDKMGLQERKETNNVIINSISDKSLQLTFKNRNQKASYRFIYIPETPKTSFSIVSLFRGLLGILSLVMIAFLFSENRSAINWKLVIKGLLIQIILALSVIYIPFVEYFFDGLSKAFVGLLSYTDEGVNFVFGRFSDGVLSSEITSFAFKILPTIVFFSAIMSILYYLGILQFIVKILARMMQWAMKLSGAESLSAIGNIFMGQTESPLLIRHYLDKMTRSEIMTLMTGGMATIAGGVLAAYIGYLGGDDPEAQIYFAKHLLTASVMSAPAAVVCAKIIVPETKEFNTDLTIKKDKIGTNILEAISNGTSDGLKLAVNVGVMLLVFTALITFGNHLLFQLGELVDINDSIQRAYNGRFSGLSFQFILANLFFPIAWLLGVDNINDMMLVGQLLGEKTIINEFYAYKTFGGIKSEFQSEKSIIMTTYILCGFANFASIGIQIGGIGALIPGRKGLLSQLGFKALIAGTLACLFTATVVGMIM